MMTVQVLLKQLKTHQGWLTIDYLKRIEDIASENDELPYEDHIQDLLFPVYTSGVAYFSFGRRKKITDQALAQRDYETAKLNVFSRFI